jgi:hypothetical protein
LRRKSDELPPVDTKTFGVFNLFSDLMQEEIASLKDAFGDEQAERTLVKFFHDALGLSDTGKTGSTVKVFI